MRPFSLVSVVSWRGGHTSVLSSPWVGARLQRWKPGEIRDLVLIWQCDRESIRVRFPIACLFHILARPALRSPARRTEND